MITIKSKLTSFAENISAPDFVKLEFNQNEINRIKELIYFLTNNKDVSYLKIAKLSNELLIIDDNEQEFLREDWREDCEGLLIYTHGIYYTACSKYDSSDMIESEDLTDNEEFLNLIKTTSHETD